MNWKKTPGTAGLVAEPEDETPYPHEELETVQLWRTPIGEMDHWMIYCGPCERCGDGTLWMWTEGQILMGVAQCDECIGSKCWNVGIETADWISWALDAIKGRWGHQQVAHTDPPSMLHHPIIP